MSKLTHKMIPIASEYEFEALCCNIAKEKYGDYDAQKYGRRGQKQWGVDIIAKDRKNKGEYIVIQCKFKTEALPFSGRSAANSREIIKNEIQTELKTALEKHNFHKFIYAANIANDAPLLDYAKELSKLHDKEIIIWHKESIDEAIALYPRLTRIYTETGIKTGVELIDQDFIDELFFYQPNVKPSIFRFYTGNSNNNEQWYGILNTWDAPRECMGAIKDRIDDLFAKSYINSKVAALVYGEGGGGKSTLLRRIAIDNVLNKKPYINWWIEDIDTFLNHELQSIEATPEQKHLLFIEDWYRNVGTRNRDKAEKLFSGLQQRNNVLVIIGDRKDSGTYSEYLYGDNKFQLMPSENNKLLSHIATKSPELDAIINKVLIQRNLVQYTALFLILYVIADTYEQNNEAGDFDIEDIESRFRKIIAKKLHEIENDEKYRGLGKALFLCAEIYADESLNYFIFSKESFIKAAQLLGNNEDLPKRIECNKEFPDQVNSLIYTRTVEAVSGRQFKFIHFNHDVLAEQGIKYAEGAGYDLKLRTDDFEIKNILDAISENGDPNTALMLWLWLYRKDRKSEHLNKLNGILIKDLALIKSSFLIYIIKLMPSDTKRKIATFILRQPEFFKLPSGIVSSALNLLNGTEEGETAAKTILQQPEFFRLQFEIVSTALNLLNGTEEGETAAKTILQQPEWVYDK